VLTLVAAVLFGLFFVLVDLGGVAAGGSVLWVALGIQLGALPTTLAGRWARGGGGASGSTTRPCCGRWSC
jgi:hypothetical protein